MTGRKALKREEIEAGLRQRVLAGLAKPDGVEGGGSATSLPEGIATPDPDDFPGERWISYFDEDGSLVVIVVTAEQALGVRTGSAGEVNAFRLAEGIGGFVEGLRYGPRPTPRDPLVDSAVVAVARRVPEIVHARQEKLSQETIDLLVDAYLKSAPTAPARHGIEMDNARERARFVEEFPCYTSRELAELAGHEAANASATATRWKKARRIIGLPWKGSDLYPAFQFREGRPRPIVGKVIESLPERMSPWQIAFWLTSSNGWLGGATPLERLDDEGALLAAAQRESEALGG